MDSRPPSRSKSERIRVFAVGGLAAACALGAPSGGAATSCDPFEPLVRWQGREFPKTLEGVQASQWERGEAAGESARLLFRAYLDGLAPTFSAEACGVGREGRRVFDYARGPAFFKEARDRLRAKGEPRIDRLLTLVDERFGVGGVPPVKFVIEGRQPSDPQLVAGVARGGKGLFANVSEIPPSDWTIVFVHELAHLVDDTLDAAVTQWQDPSLRRDAIADAWALGSAGSEVSPDRFARIDRWLRAGLDRGFLAEYRAWSVSA